jgi:hypothetical protein
MQLSELLNKIESGIPESDSLNQKVSTSPVGWHIEHTLLAINLIIDDLEKSNPDDYVWKFNLNRLIVFSINYMPRGRAKAPKKGLPQKYNSESLMNHLKKSRTNIEKLEGLHSLQYFEHHYFGVLKSKQAKKFLEMHTYHHLKIMQDIIGRKVEIEGKN